MFLIVIQLAVAVQSYLNIGKFSDSVSMVTTMADPILMSAKSLEARIHTAHSTLNEVLLSQTDKDAQALMSVLNDRRKALKQTMDELENQVKSFELDESGMSKEEKAELTATFTNINLSVAASRRPRRPTSSRLPTRDSLRSSATPSSSSGRKSPMMTTS